MTLKVSTGLRNGLLATGSLASLLAESVINIYAGTVPAEADDAIGSATLLCSITVEGGATGVSMDTTAVGGVLSKAPAEVWSGTNVASGTATFYRHVSDADTGAASTTAVRLQGNIAVAGAELNLSSVSLTSSAPQTIDYYSVAIPSL